MAKKNRLPKLAQNTTLEQGIVTLSEGISAVAEQVSELDVTMRNELSGVRQEVQRSGSMIQSAILRQSNLFEKSFGMQAKRLDKLVDLQNEVEARSASRAAAEEEAKMEQKDSLSVFLSIDDSLKKLLAATSRGGMGAEAQREGRRGLFSTLTDMIPRGGGRGGRVGIGTGIRIAAGAGLGATAGGRIGGMFGETGETVGQVAGGLLGAAGMSGLFGRTPTPTVPTPTVPTPVVQPPIAPSTVGGMTPEQQEKYKKLREQGMSPADAKAQAARREGFGGLADAEKQMQGKTTAPAGKPAVEAAETAAKKPGMLGRAVGAAGKAARFIPGVGLVLAAGEAAYSAGSAAMNAEETLGIKGREATTGEKFAAGAGGLTESLTFGLVSKEGAGGFFKGLTGAGSSAKPPEEKPIPPAPAVSAAATPPVATGAAMTPSTTAAAAAPKPKVSISGQEDIKNMIKRHEGFVPYPYKDTLGLWTIGYGHLIGDGKSLPPEWNRTLTRAEGDALFEEDYAHHRKAAEKIPGFNNLNEKGQGALTDLTFNMGPSWFRKWPKLQESLKAGDVQSAASNLESSKWYQQVKSRGPTIVSLMRQGGDGPTQSAESRPESKPIGDVATPVMTESGTPLMTGYGGVVTSGGGDAEMAPTAAPASPAPSTSGPILQAATSNKGAAVQGMSERVAARPVSAPIVINNNTTSQTTNAPASGGNGKGIPSPYAARGSLDIGTTFVGAA